MSQTSLARPAGPRPALVTFSAILLFMLGGFEFVLTVTEFFRYAFGTLPPIVNVNYSIFWGLIDALYAIVLLYAGYELLRGQQVGRLIGLIVAVFAAIRWFFYIWYIPWASVVVIAICMLVIYGLVRHEDYFV